MLFLCIGVRSMICSQIRSSSELGEYLLNAGADIIAGHHPHTVQEVEEYNGGWILYSLGNFIFDQYFSKETMEGVGWCCDCSGWGSCVC